MMLLSIVIILGIVINIEVIAFQSSISSKFNQFSRQCNYRFADKLRVMRLSHSDSNIEKSISSIKNPKAITVEIVSRKRLGFEKAEAKIVAYDAVYKEVEEDKLTRIMDKPFMKFFELLFSPITLCLLMYVATYGVAQVVWLQKIFKIFGMGTLAKKNKSDGKVDKSSEEVESVESDETPFQIFECESCGMEMRPAKGRAEIIFGRPRFRCARCGAKASAYFNIDDMSDPRAVARKERIEQEKEDEDFADDNEE